MRQQASASDAMSPRVVNAPSITEVIQAHSDTTIDLLESWLQNDDSLKCQSRHLWENNTCSVEVTHRITDCRGERFVCLNTSTRMQRWKDEGYPCDLCHQPLSECAQVLEV